MFKYYSELKNDIKVIALLDEDSYVFNSLGGIVILSVMIVTKYGVYINAGLVLKYDDDMALYVRIEDFT
jgi:hypothetical protein